MQRIMNMMKLVIIFTICTSLFYYCLKFIQQEYNQLQKYDPPQGPAVKAFQTETGFIDRLHLFFRLGE